MGERNKPLNLERYRKRWFPEASTGSQGCLPKNITHSSLNKPEVYMCKIRDFQGFLIPPISPGQEKLAPFMPKEEWTRQRFSLLLLLFPDGGGWCQKMGNNEPSEEFNAFPPLRVLRDTQQQLRAAAAPVCSRLWPGGDLPPPSHLQPCQLVSHLSASSSPACSRPPTGRKPNEGQPPLLTDPQALPGPQRNHSHGQLQ